MRKLTDLILGFIFLGFSLVVYLLMRNFPRGTIQEGMGPGFLAGLLISALALLSLTLIVQGLIRRKEGETDLEGKGRLPLFGSNLKVPGILIGIVFLYLISLKAFGFLITTPIFIIATMKLMGSGLKAAVLVGVFLTGLIYLIFVVGLKVPLPTGYMVGG